LEDSLDLDGDVDVETGDGVDLGAVVGGSLIDISIDIDSEAPRSIDLLDSSADIDKELTMALIAALASPGKLPLELSSSGTINVLESPAEGSPVDILETLKLHPVNTLRNSTSPVGLVVHDRSIGLDNFPDGLADGDDLVDVDIISPDGTSDVRRDTRDVVSDNRLTRGGGLRKVEEHLAALLSGGKNSEGNNKEKCDTHV